ncbi:MAG: hypothetical protein II149_04520 [Clostridia bacterium]|nr:hypothetical protein [Clostridia bacterium]
MNDNTLPKRKHPRLDHYDYGSAGAYFITVCVQDRKNILSRIVGRGLAPADNAEIRVLLSKYGKAAKDQLFLLSERFPCLTVDEYVIMPDHIHAIFILNNEAAGASPRPTLMDIVCTYKSLTTRECRKLGFTGKLFQTSFFEHVIRSRDDYIDTVKYIRENPSKRYFLKTE